MTERPTIIVFTRVPESGYGKTRMAPLLSEEQRCELQTACIKDVVATAKGTGKEVLLFCTPFSKAEKLANIVGEDIPLLPQTGNDLGEKMKNAFQDAFAMGHSPCILIGTDIPEITAELLESALAALQEADVVLTPTEDGGYCLVGMREMAESAFEKIEYGTRSVFETTKLTIESSGKTVKATASCHDLDTPDDLKAFASLGPLPQCPHAYAFARRVFEKGE